MTSQDRPGVLKNSPETASKMPDLLCCAQFHITAANPYEVAQQAFKVCSPPEELTAASSRVVNTGAHHFVRISVCRHVLHAWVHQDVVYRDFIVSNNDQYLPNQRLLREGNTSFKQTCGCSHQPRSEVSLRLHASTLLGSGSNLCRCRLCQLCS